MLLPPLCSQIDVGATMNSLLGDTFSRENNRHRSRFHDRDPQFASQILGAMTQSCYIGTCDIRSCVIRGPYCISKLKLCPNPLAWPAVLLALSRHVTGYNAYCQLYFWHLLSMSSHVVPLHIWCLRHHLSWAVSQPQWSNHSCPHGTPPCLGIPSSSDLRLRKKKQMSCNMHFLLKDKSDGKCRNTLGGLDQYARNVFRLWNSRDRETV